MAEEKLTQAAEATEARDAAQPAVVAQAGAATAAPSRRSLLAYAGAGLALGAAGAGGAAAMSGQGSGAMESAALAGAAVPFHGAHQAGIATPVQDRLHFAAFDVKTEDREELIQLLKDWTRAAERMTAGLTVGEERSAACRKPRRTTRVRRSA
ncbi:hypothetical protein GCM10020295_81410 [Streptomyces cinereospinus]